LEAEVLCQWLRATTANDEITIGSVADRCLLIAAQLFFTKEGMLSLT
jgi:hypothetical protein